MNRPVYSLALQTLFWLPASAAVWYLIGDLQTHWTGIAVAHLVDASFPVAVPISQQDSLLVFDLRFAAAEADESHSPPAFGATIKVDVLVHCSGLPLFVALMLASPASFGAAWRIAAGVMLLQAYAITAVYASVVLNTLKILHSVKAEARVLFGLDFDPHLILFLETLAKAVLPTLLAIVLWAVFNRRFLLEEVIGSPPTTPGVSPYGNLDRG